MNIPPPPDGFVMDAPAAAPSQIPPPPPGFEMQGAPAAPANQPAIPTTPEMAARQQMMQENADRGTATSFGASILGNFQGIAGQVQNALAKPVSMISPDAGENMRIAASRSLAYGGSPDHPIANVAGGVVGGLPGAFAGPVGAALGAVNTGAQTYGNVEAENATKAPGQQVGGGAEAADVALQTGLSFAMNLIGQKNITGAIPGQIVQKIMPNLVGKFGPAVARTIAATLVEGGVGAGTQFASNLITKGTGANPNQDLTEGVGTAAVTQGVMGGLGRGIHEGMEARAVPAAQPVPAPPVGFEVVPQQEAAGKPMEAEKAPTPPETPKPQEEAVPAPAEEAKLPEPASTRESDPAKDAILLKQRDFLEAKSRNDPAADHLAAEVQQHLMDYEQTHGEDKAEDLIAHVQGMKHEPTPPHIQAELDRILSQPDMRTPEMTDAQVQHTLDTAGFEGLPPAEAAKPAAAAEPTKLQNMMESARKQRLAAVTANGPGKTGLIEAFASAKNAATDGFVDAMWKRVQAGDAIERKGRIENALRDAQKAGTLTSRNDVEALVQKNSGRLSGGRNAGAMAFPSKEDITGPGSIYHEELKPKLGKLHEAVKFVTDTFKDTFPMESGAGDKNTSQIMREEFNKANNNQLAAADKFEDARKAFGKLKVDDQTDFQRKMYNGDKQATPELQKVADAMHTDTNEGRLKLAGLGNEAAKTWSDQWYNMMWKKDEKAAANMTKIMRPGAIEGKKSFLSKRALGDFDEGLNKGLVPKYENPVEMFLATRAERSKFIAGYQGMDRLAQQGQIKRFADTSSVPAGWEQVPNGTRGVLKDIVKGTDAAYAPVEVNRILKNIVEPSKVGNNPIYRILQGANNTITQSMLGLSAFHIRKVTQEMINLQAARALDLGIAGRNQEAGSVLKGALGTPYAAVMKGGDIQKMMLDTKMATSPEQAKVIDAMKTTFAAKADPAYETQFKNKFQKAVQDGGLQGMIRAAGYAPLAANEHLMQKGVFGYVQKAKLHLGNEMIGDYLKKNPNAAPGELNKEAAKVSDHLDNVLGLMNRDNLFWNRTARDLATLGTLSVGWNYGSGRALAGGLVDLGKGLGSLAKGGKLADIDTKRISYVATTSMLTAFTGAALTYMATGKGPQSLRDYVFPPTGAKDREGHDIRLNTGFYTSDWYDFMHHPVDTLEAKGSPILHAATDIVGNKDFTGTRVYDKDDSWYKQAGDITKYLVKSGMPLSIAQYRNLTASGTQSMGAKVAGLVGFKTAPKALSESNAEIKAHDILQERPSESPEEKAKSDLLRKYENELRDKNPQAMSDIRKAVGAKELSPENMQTIVKRSKEPTGLKGLLTNSRFRPEDLMKIWDRMTPQERTDNQWQVKGRIGRSDKLPAEKQSMFQQIAKDVRAAK